jgi:hypothetical protein
MSVMLRKICILNWPNWKNNAIFTYSFQPGSCIELLYFCTAFEFSQLRKLARNLASVQRIRLPIQTTSIVTQITWQYEHSGPRSIFIFQCGARAEGVGHPWSGNWQRPKNTAQIIICPYYTYIQHRGTNCFSTRGSVVGWGTMPQAGRSRDRIPMRSLDFFQLT